MNIESLRLMRLFALGLVGLGLGLGACAEPGPTLTPEELLDPAACQSCHPSHYEQWSGSMHAYAAEDPVFLAMNQRGQEETGGELGDFCVRCHAPMAVTEGATEDGLNLDEVSPALLGVTCAYCHRIDGVHGDHNAQLSLGDADVMAGGIVDPSPTTAHKSIYSSLHDRNDLRSSELCGTCHDIVTDAGVHLERTYAEWRETIFAQDGVGRLSCSSCHMPGSPGKVADKSDAPDRIVHDHSFPGVDLALTDFPQREEQRVAVEQALDLTLLSTLCVLPMAGGSEIVVRLENIGAGHSWPSGAAHDRRAWVQVVAKDEAGATLFSTGVVPAGESVVGMDDPYQWLFRDRIFGEDGEEVHMFWDARSLESQLIPGSTSIDSSDPEFFHYVDRSFPVLGTVPAEVELSVWIRPMGLEVIDDLVGSGHLEAEIREAIPTLEVRTAARSWTGPLDSCVPQGASLSP